MSAGSGIPGGGSGRERRSGAQEGAGPVREAMAGAQVLDVGQLPTRPSGSDAPEWWGIVSLVVIEGTVFTAAIASYFHLKLQNAQWPPPAIGAPDLLLPTLNTVLLVLTAVPAWLGVRGIRRGTDRPARVAMPIGILMLMVFLAVKVYEYAGKPWGVATHAYGSMVMLMSGLHMAHVAALIIKTGVIYQYLRSGRIEPERPAPLESNAIYWYFVIAIWVPLYATIYLSPRLLS
ncbi:MAG TPA: cytochrome c oxidase subunit 3 [Longimicrobiales bacterium]|nr:cytochrome c oxidase subunit 3 [Longimicrobiales bacterium]